MNLLEALQNSLEPKSSKDIIKIIIDDGILDFLAEAGSDGLSLDNVIFDISKAGSLEIIKYIETKTNDIKWHNVAQYAALDGSIEIIEYAKDKDKDDIDWDDIAFWAAKGGSLKALKYVETKTDDIKWKFIVKYSLSRVIKAYAESKLNK